MFPIIGSARHVCRSRQDGTAQRRTRRVLLDGLEMELNSARRRTEQRREREEKKREEKKRKRSAPVDRPAGRRAIRLHSTLIKVCATSYVSKSVKCRTERRRLLLHAHCKRTFSSPLLCEPHAESNTRHRIVSTKSPKDRAEVRNAEQSRAIGAEQKARAAHLSRHPHHSVQYSYSYTTTKQSSNRYISTVVAHTVQYI